MSDFGFKSYSWVFGTTSLRVSELKYKIEKQLLLLKELKSNYKKTSWKEEQLAYYDLLVREELAKKEVDNPESQARKKTSPLKDLGLIDEERNLTEVGEKIVDISKNKKYNKQNVLFIRNDSYIYLKQLLKYELDNGNYKEFKIRPFSSLLYLYTKLDNYITEDELKYFIPTIKTREELVKSIDLIEKYRKNKISVNLYLKNKISNMDNYKKALNYLLEKDDTSINVIKKVMMNRKSPKYDKKYYDLFVLLEKYYLKKSSINKVEKKNKIIDIINLLKDKFKNNTIDIRNEILEKLTNLDKPPRKGSVREKINSKLIDVFDNNKVISSQNIKEFKKQFFYLCHLAKWKRNLKEYFDQNKRFLRLTDIFIIKNNEIKLEIIPEIIFQLNSENIINYPLLYKKDSSDNYYNKFYEIQEKIEEIIPDFKISLEEIKNEITIKYPDFEMEEDIRSSLNKYLKDKKEQRFNNLIDEYFNKEDICKLLNHIAESEEKPIKNYIDWEADIPTIFEYIIGISWYLISDKKGYFENFLNLDLEANLLPRRFAAGGMPDLLFEYDNHNLMIEATLTNNSNQRRAELEPVTRHLGNKRLESEQETYALFVAPYLDPNVLVNFRAYKNLRYYDTSNPNEFAENLIIIPLNIQDLIYLLNNNMSYNDFKKRVFDAYESSELDGYNWYKNILSQKIRE